MTGLEVGNWASSSAVGAAVDGAGVRALVGGLLAGAVVVGGTYGHQVPAMPPDSGPVL